MRVHWGLIIVAFAAGAIIWPKVSPKVTAAGRS